MVGTVRIRGGRPLHGTVEISGAKNAALPLLAATAACGGLYRLENCPRLTDVDATAQILRHLGCAVRRDGTAIEVDSRPLSCVQIPQTLMGKLRSSVIFLGALVARCGTARLWLPGGCPIGARPIDLHLAALRELGAEVTQQGDEVCCRAERLRGGTVRLPYPSVGATENLLLAALRCRDRLMIRNAAREPEVAALCRFLRRMGVRVDGEGSGTICIEPGEPSDGAQCTVLPDRIETVTYLCALAACGGELRLAHTAPTLLLAPLEVLQSSGMELRCEGDCLLARCGPLRAVKTIRTGPYPAFATDAQAPVMAALLRAEGTSVMEETVFERRFLHVPALRAMGAEIVLAGGRAQIRGVKHLHGADVAATDLRGGAAMVIAALGAEGVSHISETQHIRRGYDGLCEKLRSLGADIRRCTGPLEETS